MARFRTGYNTTDAPVVIDVEGHVLAGGDYGPVPDSDEVKAAVDSDVIVIVDRPKKAGDLDPNAVAAFDATDKLNKADGPHADTVEEVN